MAVYFGKSQCGMAAVWLMNVLVTNYTCVDLLVNCYNIFFYCTQWCIQCEGLCWCYFPFYFIVMVTITALKSPEGSIPTNIFFSLLNQISRYQNKLTPG